MSIEIKDVMDKLDAEIKKMEDVIKDGLTKQEKGLEGTALKATQLQDLMNKAEEKFLALETEKKDLEKRLSELEVKFQRPDFGSPDKPLLATAGQQFILSEQYQEARDLKSKIVPTVEIPSFFERKQIAGALRGDLPPDRAPVWPHQVPELIYEPGQREFSLMNIMNSSPTSSNLIEYFKEVIDDSYDGAGPQDHETHEKSLMSFNFELASCPVQTIAVSMPASRQVLDDAPQLQSYIDGRLTYNLKEEIEREILYGNGAGGQLLGIANTPGIQTIAPTGTQTSLDVIRLAAALIRVVEYQPTGIVLHPNDFAAIELLKDSQLRYIWVQVPNGGEMRLWRVPVIETTVIQEGQFLMGAFGMGAQIWDRQQAGIRISEHHEDYFRRNAVLILAEARLALCVYRPSAFVMGTIGEVASS